MRRNYLVIAVAICAILSRTLVSFAEQKSATEPRNITAAGVVLDAEGKPVPDVRVVLRESSNHRYSENLYHQGPVDDILAETRSDEKGHFYFTQVPAKPFRTYDHLKTPWDVVAMTAGHGLSWTHLEAAHTNGLVVMKLRRSETFVGRVLNPAGKPIADCQIEVNGFAPLGSAAWGNDDRPDVINLNRSQIALHTTTDEEGLFEIEDLPAGMRLGARLLHPQFVEKYAFLTAADGPQPPVELPGDREPMPVHANHSEITLEPGASLTGRVLYAGSGEKADRKAIGNRIQLRLFPGGGYRFSETDTQGMFQLNSLPPGNFTLTVKAKKDSNYLSARQRGKLTAERSNEPLEIRLSKGIPVTGRVIDAETGEGAADVPIAYFPPPEEPDERYQGETNWWPAQSVKSAADGSFTVHVPAGPGTLRVSGNRREPHAKYDLPDYFQWQYKENLLPTLLAEIDVEPDNPPKGVELRVDRGRIVRGTLVDAEGKPVVGAEVHISDTFSRPLAGRIATSDAEGHYELSGLPRVLPNYEYRDYHLIAKHDQRGLTASLTFLTEFAQPQETPYEAGELKLRSTGTARGQVLVDGQPQAGVKVQVGMVIRKPKQDGFRTNNVDISKTDEQGRFEISGLEAGRGYHFSVHDQRFTNGSSRVVKLDAGKPLELPPIELKGRSAFVAGVVVDLDGNPIAGVTIGVKYRNGRFVSMSSRSPRRITDKQGRFRIEDVPSEPLQLMAYIRPPAGTKDRGIHFPAHADANPGQEDVRIVLDPKLQKPLP